MANADEGFPFPEVLPDRPPMSVLDWRDGTVLKTAKGIAKDTFFAEVPVLADALEEAGCTDEVILDHLRRHKHGRHGCWHDTCWVVQLVLDLEQAVECRFRWPVTMNCDISKAKVINPGGWQGRIWLVGETGMVDPPVYVVEAEYATDAEDEFIESEYGAGVRIDPDSPEADDYGELFSAGDQIANQVFEKDTWVTVSGKEVEGPLGYALYTGCGTRYDSESVVLYGPEQIVDARYFGPGLPHCGVWPENYSPRMCDNCKQDYFITDDWADKDCCSPRCRWHWGAAESAPKTVCPVCYRYVDPAECVTYLPEVVPVPISTVGLHFPTYAYGDYAMPAEDVGEVMEDIRGEVIRVCPGSGQVGQVEWPEPEGGK